MKEEKNKNTKVSKEGSSVKKVRKLKKVKIGYILAFAIIIIVSIMIIKLILPSSTSKYGNRLDGIEKITFGDKEKNPNLLVSSTKSMHGHMLGATGAVEALVCAKVIKEGKVPPTINLDNQDEHVANLDYVPHKAREKKVHAALSNSFGFGGHNATLIIKEV